ncbi:replication initiator protein [Microviridae sp.]|nr:replication initiator protein [Microviridae sp.]
MPCYHPLKAYRKPKGGVTFSPTKGYRDVPVTIPCGQCIGCRLERSRQWAVRCMHETQLHENNCFITLTYNDTYLPHDRSLKIKDFQLFMKRLRKKYTHKIRFYHCGEYGEKLGRPHYHAILFGHDFHDKKHHKTINEIPLYVSEELNKLWGMGHCTLGTATFDSAAYCARYILKKVTGDGADDHYQRVDPETGEVFQLAPEYTTMSRRPGIGHGWLKKYQSDVYPSDEVIVNAKQTKPPKYYDNQYELTNPKEYDLLKSNRVKQSKKQKENNTPERLKIRETIKKHQLKQLPRS